MILKHIAKIIKDYMDLDQKQIWIKNEKLPLPKDDSFVVSIGFMGLKCLGTTREQLVDQETISSTMSGQVAIDIFGRNFEVLTKKEEIIQAMACGKCKESQIANGFLIGQSPTTMNDISGIDGAEIPYRFQITFNIQFISTKTKMDYYYDDFSNEVKYDPT